MTARITTLSSGLRVVSQFMPQLETLAIDLLVATGARAETAAEGGAAHMLEHMAFKGTQRRSARDIAEEIENIGASINASTSFEATDYSVRLLKGDSAVALDILADILQTPVFSPEEVDREKDVILQEIAGAADQPDDMVFELLQTAGYPAQPLGRPILGTRATVTGFTPETLIAYRNETYAAPRMVLAAAGAVDHDELCALADRLFDRLGAAPERPLEPARFVGGARSLVKRTEQAHVTLAFPAPSYRDDGFYAANIGIAVLGGGISSRLFQEAREKRGLCYDIGSFYAGYADTGMAGMHAALSPGEAGRLGALVMAQWQALGTIGPSDAEIARCRAQFKAGVLMGLESCEARAGHIARDVLLFGRIIEAAELIERVEAVTANNVRDETSRMLAGPPALATVGARGVAAAWAEACAPARIAS